MKHRKSQNSKKQKQRTKPRYRIARPHGMAVDLGRAVYQMAKLNSRMDQLTAKLQTAGPVDSFGLDNPEAIHDYSGIGGADEHRAAVVLLDAILAAEHSAGSTPRRKTVGRRRVCPAERSENQKHGVVIKRFQYAIRRYLKYRFPRSWERILEEL